jgi:hypothetical protein
MMPKLPRALGNFGTPHASLPESFVNGVCLLSVARSDACRAGVAVGAAVQEPGHGGASAPAVDRSLA